MTVPIEALSDTTQTFEAHVLDEAELPGIPLSADQHERRVAVSPAARRADRVLAIMMLQMSHDPDSWHAI